MLLAIASIASSASAQVFGPMAPIDADPVSDDAFDFGPQVTADGAGNWVAVWSSESSLGGTTGDDFDILISRSTDAGATWTSPAALNNNATSDIEDDFYPQVTTDGAGNWVAVWHSSVPQGNIVGIGHDVRVARSSDAGATWTVPAPLNISATPGEGEDAHPQVATDGLGNWVAVWHSTETLAGIGTDEDILFSRSSDAGGTWTAPGAMPGSATDSSERTDWYPQVTTDGAGNWLAVWYARGDFMPGSDRDIWISRSFDAGATWTSWVALNTNAAADSASDLFPQLTTDGAGNWLAVWHADESPDDKVYYARSIDIGVTWTDPLPLNSDFAAGTGDSREIQVTTDGIGTWIAVWQKSLDHPFGSGANANLSTATSTDAGVTWTAAVPLASNTLRPFTSDRHPQVATDGAGNWISVWRSTEKLGGPDVFEYDIFYATIPGLDADSDGLADGAELVAGTNPLVPDTDGDGLSDGDEIHVYATNALVPDTDGDGLSDGDEVNLHGSDPLDTDTDSDDLDDGDEVNVWGSDILEFDTDGDGLKDGDEVHVYGTEPVDADTDDDGLRDGWEVTYGFDPLVAGEQTEDPDSDGLDNLGEQTAFSNPFNPDTDGDWLTDGLEISVGAHPLLQDTDFDGWNDWQEWKAGSDPNDPESVPAKVPGLGSLGQFSLAALLLAMGSRVSLTPRNRTKS